MKRLGILIWTALISMGFVTPVLADDAKPNVLFILADDMGYGDPGCYGCPDIRTPNIDKLATQGVRMTDFYANGPVCSPTRCGFMTGRYQQRIGGIEWALHIETDWGLPPTEKTIARLLHDAGYSTAMSGKWHLGSPEECRPNAHGFDHYFGLLGGNHDYFAHCNRLGEPDLFQDTEPVVIQGYSTNLITDRAIDYLEQIKDKPFFLYLAYNAPHWPWQGPNDKAIKDRKKDWMAGTRTTYVEMVESQDQGVGKVLAALDRLGLSKQTLVVFTSDNGGDRRSRNTPLAKQKGTLWEGGIRVPCIARWPGRLPASAVSHQVGITHDWTATIAKLTGAKPPANRPFDGIDLLPILAGKEPVRKRTLFWRRVDFKMIKSHRAVRHEDWKYIDEPNGKEYLYDLGKDISESNNLADKYPKRAKELKKMIDGWEDEVDPPLYQPASAGTQTNAVI